MLNIILASKSKVRKEILVKNNINCKVMPSNIDEEVVKKSLIQEKASPEISLIVLMDQEDALAHQDK